MKAMKLVMGLVVVLAAAGSARAEFSTDVNWSDLKSGAAKMSTPASQPVAGLVKVAYGDELYYKVDFNVGGGRVNAVIDVSNRDFATVNRFGGYVEVRLYAGDDRGHMKRLKDYTYEMRSDRQSFTFPSRQVCDRTGGTYDRYVKVWASARDNGGKPMSGYTSDPKGIYIKVTCVDWGWSNWFFD